MAFCKLIALDQIDSHLLAGEGERILKYEIRGESIFLPDSGLVGRVVVSPILDNSQVEACIRPSLPRLRAKVWLLARPSSSHHLFHPVEEVFLLQIFGHGRDFFSGFFCKSDKMNASDECLNVLIN